MDIKDVFEQYNIHIAPENHEHVRPGWVQIDCPFCSKGSERYRLGYNLIFNYCNCWNCGHHSIISVLVEILGINYKKAKGILSDVVATAPKDRSEHKGHLAFPHHAHTMLPQHIHYLKHRGYDYKKIMELWQIKAIGPATRLAWRLLIPIHKHGELVSWTTRTISKNKNIKRYISASINEESYPHKKLLYGEDYARHAVAVVEGPTDVWSGGPGFVGTFGLSLTNEQIALIAKYPIRAICFDNTPDAQRTAKKIVGLLSSLPGDTYHIILDSDDVGDASFYKEIKTIRKNILQ